MARIAKSAVEKLREKGKKAGLLRPITLWPFPQKIFKRLAMSDKQLTFLTVEMSYGQMLEDVQLAVEGKAKVEFLGRSGGGIPSEEAIINKTLQLLKN
jgi:2-oxoglutarate ferredoxin oxidoreductase subunit alpha